uniref:Uncharacterized protein n=1 Tax=Setaria italica TaxID=4555 RepID=K3Y2C0_SETIT
MTGIVVFPKGTCKGPVYSCPARCRSCCGSPTVAWIRCARPQRGENQQWWSSLPQRARRGRRLPAPHHQSAACAGSPCRAAPAPAAGRCAAPVVGRCTTPPKLSRTGRRMLRRPTQSTAYCLSPCPDANGREKKRRVNRRDGQEGHGSRQKYLHHFTLLPLTKIEIEESSLRKARRI